MTIIATILTMLPPPLSLLSRESIGITFTSRLLLTTKKKVNRILRKKALTKSGKLFITMRVIAQTHRMSDCSSRPIWTSVSLSSSLSVRISRSRASTLQQPLPSSP